MRHFFRTRAHWPYAPAARNIDIGGQGALQSDAHPGVIYFANTGVDVPLLFSEINMFLFRADFTKPTPNPAPEDTELAPEDQRGPRAERLREEGCGEM